MWRYFSSGRQLIPILQRMSALLEEASSLLIDMNGTMDASAWKRTFAEIRSKEHMGDALLTEFREISANCYMKAGTRREMTTVAMSADDALDVIKDAANALNIYSPAKVDETLLALTRIIGEQSHAIAAVMSLLNDMKGNSADIILQADRITELERDADELYEQYIGQIFRSEPDLREMTKYKNLAELYEKATDSEKHVADCIRILMMRFVR